MDERRNIFEAGPPVLGSWVLEIMCEEGAPDLRVKQVQVHGRGSRESTQMVHTQCEHPHRPIEAFGVMSEKLQSCRYVRLLRNNSSRYFSFFITREPQYLT